MADDKLGQHVLRPHQRSKDGKDHTYWSLFAGLAPNGRLNLEGIQLSPVLVEGDHFYFHLLGGNISQNTGLIVDRNPPFGLYPVNLNQIQMQGNPFDEKEYRKRYFGVCDQTNADFE
jgi:hypothetical protein